MFHLLHGGRRAAASLPRRATTTTCLLHRTYASRIDLPFTPPPVPVIEQCPVPSCQCRETPPDLDIEREQNINGSMAAYAEQVLISTGKADWTSKTEEDETSVLLRQLRDLLVRDGKYSDVRAQPQHVPP